jgi:hypothetical protein
MQKDLPGSLLCDLSSEAIDMVDKSLRLDSRLALVRISPKGEVQFRLKRLWSWQQQSV